jgi:hypothetical protein
MAEQAYKRSDEGAQHPVQHPTVDEEAGVLPPTKQKDTFTDSDPEGLENDPYQSEVNPPPSCGERLRDRILRTLDRPFFQYLGIAVLLGVVASGAVFFFFLMGWQTLCRPRTDCQPRNDIYNVSVQFLNGFFTYMATVSMPWRCSNMLHTLGWACPRRERSPGHDLYGQVTDDVWFSVPLRQRAWILQYLLWNCLTQYANQVTRIIYYNYELQNEYPGNLWTNLFFGLSMLCAATGGTLMAYHTGKVRARDPARFGPGPVQLARDLYKQVVWGKAADNDDEGRVAEGVISVDSSSPPRRTSQNSATFDPTREPQRRSLVEVSRSSLRLFAM